LKINFRHMKKLSTFLIACVCLMANAQWQQSGGPEGSIVSDILYLKENLYAKAGNQTYFKSTDLGDNWEKLGFSGITLTEGQGIDMVATANYLIALHYGGVYYSKDGGSTWSDRSNGITTPYYGGTLIENNGNLYLSSYLNQNAYVSTDEGANWELLGRGGLGVSDNFSDGIFEIGNNLVAPEHGTGAYYSTDGGENWSKSSGLPGSVEKMVVVNGKIYTCSVNNGIYESDDDGVNWTKIISLSSSYSLFEEQNNLFVDTNSDSIYLVNPTAKSITPYTDMGAFPRDIESNGGSIWFGASNRGFHRSANSGTVWTMANKGLGYTTPVAFGHIDSTFFCIAGGGLWKSTTLGTRWVPTKVVNDYFEDLLVVGTDIYACSENSTKVTSDQGKSWTKVGSGYPGDITSPSLGTHDGDLYMYAQQGGNSGLYRLENFTGDWAKVSNAPDGGGAFDVIGDTMYVAKKYSTNGGDSWSSINGINGLGVTYKIVKTKGVSYMGTNPFQQEPAYKSSDGVSFSAYTSGLPSKCGGLWPHVAKEDTVFAIIRDDATNATRARSVYFTTNTSGTWKEFVEGLPTDAEGYSMYLTPYSLLLGVDHEEAGVYRYDFKTLPEIPDTADQIEYPEIDPVDVSLKSLTAGTETLDPSFSSGNLNYTVELATGTTTVPTVNAEANDDSATVDITQAVNVNGTQSERTATIVVTGKDGETTRTYTVLFYVKPAEGKDATLSSLEVSQGTLNPSFSPAVENYTVTLPEGTTETPTVTAETNDANATKEVDQATNITGSEAERTATVVVTSEDETATRTYSVVFSIETGAPVNDIKENITSIYPNPVSGTLNIQSERLLNEIIIYNNIGKRELQYKPVSNKFQLDISHLQRGIYMLQILESDGNINTRKIIKQ
jgi:photosystem II stability/assembly factor-like uncharacterized protein